MLEEGLNLGRLRHEEFAQKLIQIAGKVPLQYRCGLETLSQAPKLLLNRSGDACMAEVEPFSNRQILCFELN